MGRRGVRRGWCTVDRECGRGDGFHCGGDGGRVGGGDEDPLSPEATAARKRRLVRHRTVSYGDALDAGADSAQSADAFDAQRGGGHSPTSQPPVFSSRSQGPTPAASTSMRS